MPNLPPLSLYIHIPWCVQKCPYCDFNSHALKDEVPHVEYVQHLLRDLEIDLPLINGREVRTIFIGGGTPSLLSSSAMQMLMDGVRARLNLAADAEITMEANPGTVEADRFVEYQRAGVNRISIGVQSFSDEKLRRLGRIHGPEEAKRAAHLAAGLGLRRAERGVFRRHQPDDLSDDERVLPSEALVNPNKRLAHQGDNNMVKSIGFVVGDALSFGDTIERLLAAGMMVVLGVTLAQHWNIYGVLIGLVLFVVVRPLAVWLVTLRAGLPLGQRLLIGWLGIRGIGSLNYIAYAWTHGMEGPQMEIMTNMALTLVVCSVVVHGTTVSPLLNWRQKRLEALQRKV